MDQVKLEDGQSLDLISENTAKLKELFPEAFSEGRVNFETLRQLLGDEAVLAEGEEKYGLNWHGKKKARQIALAPSAGTLLPCPEESLDWDRTQNLFIEGDNLEVLKLLQKSYANKVKMIYIDPPYNTGKEFIYPDRFQENLDTYLKYTGQVDEGGARFSSNSEVTGRKHTAWLTMMYPRLKLARSLLSNDGFIFISIDDNEQSNLKLVCDEIFGEENFRGKVSRSTGTPSGQGYDILVNEIDYLLVYTKSSDSVIGGLPLSQGDEKIYDQEDELGKYLIRPLRKTGGEDRREDRPTMYYPVTCPDGYDVYPIGPGGYESRWRCGPDKYRELKENGRIFWKKVDDNGQAVWRPYQKFYLEGRLKQPSNLWRNIEGNKKASIDIKNIFGFKAFDFPKPIELIERCIDISTEEGDLVLDFFAGSSTTAHSVLRYNLEKKRNLRFIMVQLPEPCDEKTEAYKNGYKTLSSLSADRIRKVSNRIRSEIGSDVMDLGFKFFKLGSSNIKAWSPEFSDLEGTLLSHEEHLTKGRSKQDILYELLLKRGVDLSVPVETRNVDGQVIYSIGYGVLFACLEDSISRQKIEIIAQEILDWYVELSPSSETHVFFRDSAFEDDVSKTNMAAILEQNGISHVRSL